MEHEVRELHFAVVGHPNEGKSSVVATLIEDDAIRVSPWPGETRKSEEYALQPGKEIRLSFVDTPGFQSPRRALEWIRSHEDRYGGRELVKAFLEAHAGDPDFRDECEIFETLLQSTGLLYVVDVTRPLRKGDLAEMEILRLLGLPRMAVMNPKDSRSKLLEDWKHVLRKNFNAIHIFNALSAGFAERTRLLSSLQSMDPDLGGLLLPLIVELEEDWTKRLTLSAGLVLELVENVAAFHVTGKVGQKEDVRDTTRKLMKDWQGEIRGLEKKSWNIMRELFRHKLFAPVPDLLQLEDTDLFSKESFRIFGLSRHQLALIGGGSAAALASGVDLALGGASLGLVGLAAGAAGAGWAYWGTRKTNTMRFAGIRISGVDITVGPVRDVRIPWMVLDRSLMLFYALVTRSHAVRNSDTLENRSHLHQLDKGAQKKIFTFITQVSKGKPQNALREEISRFLFHTMQNISGQKK